MPTFIIEREMPHCGEMKPEELEAIARKSNDVLAEIPVRYKPKGYLSGYIEGNSSAADEIVCWQMQQQYDPS